MLIAIDPDGRRMPANRVGRDTRMVCPECGDSVVRKMGRKVVPHFAHRPGSDCAIAQGETIQHLQMKSACERWFTWPGAHVELEVPVLGHGTDRRADAVVSTPDRRTRFAVECQASPISRDDLLNRTIDLNNAGLSVMWIFHHTRLLGTKEWDAAATGNCEARIPAEILMFETVSDRILTVSPDYDLCDIGIEPVDRWSDEYGRYTPKTIRWLHRPRTHRAGFIDVQERVVHLGYDGDEYRMDPVSLAEVHMTYDRIVGTPDPEPANLLDLL